jgi:hypothetical protein
MKIKIIIILFMSFFISIVSYCKTTKICSLETQVNYYLNDTLSFNIYNNSPDTLFVSLYLQILTTEKDTITYNDDIFSNPSNPNETTIRLLPQEKKEIITRVYNIEVNLTDKLDLTEDKVISKYRLLIISKSNFEKNKHYSKWFFLIDGS